MSRDLNLSLIIRARDQASGPLGRIGSSLKGLITVAGTMSLAFGAIKMGEQYAKFEQGLLNIKAVSGATALEFDLLKKSALDAASATRFNPTQTTEALYNLASAGFNATDSMTALTPVLNLAAATQSSLSLASENVTAILGMFNLKATETTKIADVLTAAVGASSLNAERVAVAFRNAGATSNAMGQSFEATTAALALLTNSFKSGEVAGTSLKSLLNELNQNGEKLGITVRNDEGAFRPLVEIIKELEAAGWTANDAVSKLGADAGPALAILLTQGSQALTTMSEKIQSQGQAAKTANEQNSGLQGALDSLSSSAEVAATLFGEAFAPGMKKAAEALKTLLVSEDVKRVIRSLGETASEIAQTIVTAFGKIAAGYGWLTDKMNQFKKEYENIAKAISSTLDMINPFSGLLNLLNYSSSTSSPSTVSITKDWEPSIPSNPKSPGSYAVGTRYIPRDGLIMAHQGETITSNSTTTSNSFGDFVFHANGAAGGLPASRDEWRQLVRHIIMPELQAVAR